MNILGVKSGFVTDVETLNRYSHTLTEAAVIHPDIIENTNN